MNKKSVDEYIVLFQGAKLSRREANKVGLGLIFGLIGAVISIFLLGTENKEASLLVCFILAVIGYFWIGNKIFKT